MAPMPHPCPDMETACLGVFTPWGSQFLSKLVQVDVRLWQGRGEGVPALKPPINLQPAHMALPSSPTRGSRSRRGGGRPGGQVFDRWTVSVEGQHMPGLTAEPLLRSLWGQWLVVPVVGEERMQEDAIGPLLAHMCICRQVVCRQVL